MIKNIVIVGGGTAGWLAANYTLSKDSNVNVTVVASNEIPIIGVGESTTGVFNDFIRANFNEEEFLKETGSTFKIGIKHSDWNEIGKSFLSPLGDDFLNHTQHPEKQYDYMRIFHVANKEPITNLLQSKLMAQNKLPLVDVDESCPYKGDFPGPGKYTFRIHHTAYHLDAYRVAQYLKKKALLNPRCTFIEGKVHSTTLDEGRIVSLNVNGKDVYGDLYFDCTGMARVLANTLNIPFIKYTDSLIVNRALPYHIKNKPGAAVRNYTHAKAMPHGWIWEIPLQERMGCGYVYCDDYLTPEQAKQEVEEYIGEEIIPQNDIKFTSGRLDKFWVKNMLAIGLSSAFVEPLEATSIHCTTVQLKHFFEMYYSRQLNTNNTVLLEQYNKEMTGMWDDVRDFITLHYVSKRTDTEFWKRASSQDRHSQALRDKLSIWKDRMPRVSDYVYNAKHNFYSLGNSLWYQILIGMDLLDSQVAKNELIEYNLYEHAKKDYEYRSSFTQWFINNCKDTNSVYENLSLLNEYKKLYGN